MRFHPPVRLGRGRSAELVILVQQDQAAHLKQEYVQLIGGVGVVTFTAGA